MTQIQAQVYHAAQCRTCATEEVFFTRWIDRDHWVHDDHAGHEVATWLQVR